MADTNENPKPARKRRKLSGRRKLAFIFVALLVGLLFSEGILQIGCLVSPTLNHTLRNDFPPTIDDPVLGVRPNPALRDHDAAGWRNPERLARADLVCIGDSQTYGTSCARDEAWPLVLGTQTGTSSYSMAYGGYGPAHYLALTPEALELKPKLLLVAVYAGNDLADSYTMVYEHNQMPELRNPDAAAVAAIEAEGNDYFAGWNELQNFVSPPANDEPSFRDQLSRWFRLYAVARTVKRALNADAEAAKQADPDRIEQKWQKRKALAAELGDGNKLFVYEQENVRTLLTPQARADAMNLNDAKIAEGLRISKQAFEGIIEKAGGHCTLAFVFIPTKENVFYAAAKAANNSLPAALEAVVADETRLWSELKTFLDDRSVPWIELLPALRAQVGDGQNPYLENWDGHPTGVGNAAMAKAISESPVVMKALAD